MAPLFGVLLHAIGGLAAGSFYAPLRGIRGWSWETGWLIMNVVAYGLMPCAVAWYFAPPFLRVLWTTPMSVAVTVFLFGVLWGVGGLTFGLALRYLGLSLGMAMSLGLCVAFGTFIPAIVDGALGQFFTTLSGATILAGVIICLAGISLCGYAGIRKERELSDEQKQLNVNEFALGKGFAMAVVAGVMSSFMALGLVAGKPIGRLAVQSGIADVYQNTPALVLVMGGNAAANVVWCLLLGVTAGSLRDFVLVPTGRLAGNYLLAILAGVIGYQEFFWYGMGTTKMGHYDFSSWPIHLAFVIVFSSLWGVYFHEWRGIGRRTQLCLWAGLATLLLSAAVIGIGNCISTLCPPG